MKNINKTIIVLAILIGYISNMYFLTVDPNTRKYQWVNKVGIIIIPLGAVMGWVYIIDNNKCITKCIKKEK